MVVSATVAAAAIVSIANVVLATTGEAAANMVVSATDAAVVIASTDAAAANMVVAATGTAVAAANGVLAASCYHVYGCGCC